jgi:predicted aspartyl protease
MLLEAVVNGQRARFIVDTGANISVLEGTRARALGVSAVGSDSPYGEFAILNGRERCRVGYITSLRAASMDFGGGPMALFSQANAAAEIGTHLPRRDESEDGLFGADILTRYKAVINCFTKTIFFKTGSSSHPQLAQFAASQRFVRVPLREEASHTFTVPGSVNGHRCRLSVDTGAFVTVLDLRQAKEFGLSFTETFVNGNFTDGINRRIGLSQVANLMIGDYHVPAQKLAAEELPSFAVEEGGAHVAGILGMEFLRTGRAIIDFDTMSLFLK